VGSFLRGPRTGTSSRGRFRRLSLSSLAWASERTVGPVFVQRLPVAPTRQYANARVLPLSEEIVSWWHRTIQPVVDATPGRADAGWCWPLFTAFNHWREPLTQRPQGFAVCAEHDASPLPTQPMPFPLALVQLVTRFPYVPGVEMGCVLLQYLSTVPRELLPRDGLRLVGRAGVDTAIVRSIELGYGGRTVLTVGKRDAERLAQWYSQTCGMREAPRPQARCFYYDENSARHAYSELQHLRIKGLGDDR
jgi:hypothetical protein